MVDIIRDSIETSITLKLFSSIEEASMAHLFSSHLVKFPREEWFLLNNFNPYLPLSKHILLFSELLTEDTVELVCSRFCDLMKLGMNIQECFDDKNPHKKELEKYKKDIMFLYNTWMDENEKYK